MCRSTDFPNFRSADRDRLKIRGFYVRLSFPNPRSRRHFPDSLTLLYLPRISEHSLEIDGSTIRPDLPAFVTLHRVVSEDAAAAASFGSRDRVCASEGLRFEVYAGSEKALKGVLRRDEYGEWAVDCKCALEGGCRGGGAGEAEVCVVPEGHVAMVERVEMVAPRRKPLRGLEEIPEEMEVEEEEDEDCCCGCCLDGEGGASEDGADSELGSCGGDAEECAEEMEVNTEGVKWAVDVGIWAVCVGVGILVSRASARRLRRRKFF